jgi:hypothetical protein
LLLFEQNDDGTIKKEMKHMEKKEKKLPTTTMDTSLLYRDVDPWIFGAWGR